MKNSVIKTNAIRILEQKKAEFKVLRYTVGEAPPSGIEAAALLGQDPARVYKTLVTAGRSGEHYVFIIPVGAELDLRKAAEAAGEKSIAMVKSRELLPLTGYIHGGCSPVGMKKAYPTFLDSSAVACTSIIISAGKVGMHIDITVLELQKAVSVRICGLTADR